MRRVVLLLKLVARPFSLITTCRELRFAYTRREADHRLRMKNKVLAVVSFFLPETYKRPMSLLVFEYKIKGQISKNIREHIIRNFSPTRRHVWRSAC